MTFFDNCYVSSKLRHRQMWIDSGIRTISSWINGEALSEPDELDEMWSRYFEELSECSCLIMYLEHGDVPKGALIELGAALANNKIIYIIWNSTEKQLENIIGTVMYHSNVIILNSIDELYK